MKIIQFLFLLIPVSLISQKEFAPINTVWNYEGHELDCNGNHINYVVEKEEIIDGKDCSVIFAYTASNLNTNFIISPDSLIVWENDNKVYFLQDSIFYLLFDFDLSVGDTVTYYEPINKPEFSTNPVMDISQGPNEYMAEVTQIENVTISNTSLRSFDTKIISPDDSYGLRNSIIENVGSLSQNFTGDHQLFVADGCFGGLQCYDNGQIEYKTESLFQTPNPSCDFLDSTEETEINNSIQVYPIPARHFLHIETTLQIEKIEILDLRGQQIKSETLSNIINVEELIPGIYILTIKLENGINSMKFVKE